MQHVIAIDLGASNGRLMLAQLDKKKLTLTELHRFPNGPIEKENELFWDIKSIMNEIEIGLKKYSDQYGEPLLGIGVDTWGVDFGFISSNNELLENPYCYRGSHTDGILEEVHQLINERELFTRTGLESEPINSLYQLAGLMKKRPELMNEAQSILTMPSLINFLLTGEKYNEYTHASTTQLLNYDTQDWDKDIMETVFSKILPLAPIKETHTIMGKTNVELNDRVKMDPVPVINVPGHDTACALSAMPIEEDNTIFMSCGTWVLIGVEVEKPVVSDDAFAWGFTNEGTVDQKYRLQKNNMGLWLLQQTKKEWEDIGEPVSYEEEAQLIKEATPFRSLIDPDDDLFFNPPSMIKAVQTFCEQTGQAIPETKGEILSCIIESLALKYNWLTKRIEQLIGQEVPRINMGGGGIQNTTLCQYVANATQKPVKAGPIEASAIGNALSQFIALGEFDNLAETREVSRESFALKDYSSEDKSVWDEAYDHFINILPKI